MLLHILIVVGTLVCATQAIRSKRLLTSALWLAGASALVALLTYMLGAPTVAVIELSVGAGLVTVLFVFAINVAGEEPLPQPISIPRPLAWGLILAALLLLGWMVLPSAAASVLAEALPAQALWETRELDLLLQVVLIFCGVMGVLGLLSDSKEIRPAHPEVKR